MVYKWESHNVSRARLLAKLSYLSIGEARSTQTSSESFQAFMCWSTSGVNLTPKILRHTYRPRKVVFWVCLWECFQTRLAHESQGPRREEPASVWAGTINWWRVWTEPIQKSNWRLLLCELGCTCLLPWTSVAGLWTPGLRPAAPVLVPGHFALNWELHPGPPWFWGP